TIDARAGVARVTGATGRDGRPQSAQFAGASFRLQQGVRTHPVTDLYVRGGDFSRCRRRPVGRRASASSASTASRRVIRRLWGSGHGRFRTHGRYSSAAVRGTIWRTEDRCDGTLTTVVRGRVLVRDVVRHRNVYVRSGHSYLARAPRRSR